MLISFATISSVYIIQDNWSALKGKMFGRSISGEGGQGKETETRSLPETREAKKGGEGVADGANTGKALKKTGNCQKGQQGASSQVYPTSPRKNRRSQRSHGKGKGGKQGF